MKTTLKNCKEILPFTLMFITLSIISFMKKDLHGIGFFFMLLTIILNSFCIKSNKSNI